MHRTVQSMMDIALKKLIEEAEIENKKKKDNI
jgi:hypothetical protein